MKKLGILNSEISKVLCDLEHTDKIVIADIGLLVPPNVKKIDLFLKHGVPSFEEVLEVILKDMQVESVTLAEELTIYNTQIKDIALQILGNINIEYVPYEFFKRMTHESKAIVRTGEASPYANIILHAGVIF